MITVPVEQLKERIVQEAKLSVQEVEARIGKKMEELSGLISEEGAAHIVANELGVQIFSGSSKVNVGSLRVGMRNVEAIGKVIRKYGVTEFQTARGAGKVGSFVLGDETGSIRVAMWNAQADNFSKFNEGDVVKIVSGYVKDNNGSPELHMNDRSSVAVNPEGVSVDAKVNTAERRAGALRKSIAELKENEENAEILVTIVDVFEPRYFTVCEKCGKRAVESSGKYNCSVHGDVESALSYVVNAVGDDGSDTIRIVFWRNQAERLLGLNSDEILKFKDYPEQFSDVKHRLLGEMVRLVGRVNKNTMFDRLEFNAQLVFMNPDPAEEIKRLEQG